MIRLALITVLCVAAPLSQATVFNAANTTIGAVSNALFLCASSGDAVSIPSGNASWTNGLFVNKEVGIYGAGRGSTIISNASDGLQADTHYRPLFYFLLPSTGTSYFGGLTITSDPSQAANIFSAGVVVEGSNEDGRRMSITNVHWTNLNCNSLTIESALGGVFDSQFDVSTISIYGYGRTHNGGSAGSGAWATNDNFGTDQFWFIERCGFKRIVDDGRTYTTVDGYAGWRYVARYCALTNTTLEGHGPETASYGTRAAEIYMCHFHLTVASGLLTYIRSGPALIFSNTVSFSGAGDLATEPFTMPYARFSEPIAVWGAANGTNVLDSNMAGGPFGTGTVVSTNFIDGRCATMTVAGSPWTPNQWYAYSIIRTTDVGGNGVLGWSIVLSNSANTIYHAIGQNGQLHFAAGDSFEFRKVMFATQQHGRGKNDELSPCYQWNNTNAAGTVTYRWGPGFTSLIYTNGIDYSNGVPKVGYTSYTYPNPLSGGGSSPPAGPDPSAKAAFGIRGFRM